MKKSFEFKKSQTIIETSRRRDFQSLSTCETSSGIKGRSGSKFFSLTDLGERVPLQICQIT